MFFTLAGEKQDKTKLMQNDSILVLLADDDEDDRLFFIAALEELKIKTIVETVNDGAELICRLNQKNLKLPHVLFLDLNMPYKNGIECLCEIKKNEHLKNMAVAIFSTSASEKEIEETFVKGANVYIKKPTEFSKLKKVLSNVITTQWQYQTSDLNRANFLMSL